MPTFKFRLAPVLRYRQWIEDEKKWQLYTLEEARNLLARSVAELTETTAALRSEMEEQTGKFLTVFDLKLQGDFFEQIERRISEARGLLATAEQMVGEKRDEVIEADKQVKVLQRLKEHRWERHREQEARAEQKLLDEAAQRQHSSLRAESQIADRAVSSE